MHKAVISSLLGVLLLCGGNVFGQFFKEAQKAAKNLTNLEQALKLAAQRSVASGPILTHLSPVTIEKHLTGTLKMTLPQSFTCSVQLDELFRENPSLAYSVPQTLSILLVHEWASQTGNRQFYKTQSALAQDLDAFYGGNVPVLVGPDGRKVKLYALPVNGIWYKPTGYSTPVVLNADDYFVIYDTQSKTGKIADNRPEVYNLFNSPVYDAIWKAMGADKTFDDLGNLCDTILMAHLHKARLEKLGATSDIKTVAKQGKSIIWRQLNTPEVLLSYLKQLPKVRQSQSGFKAYVVELPVEGLTWVEPSGMRHVYNSKEHVMLFFEMGLSSIYPRADVENPQLFQKIKK